MPSEPYAKNDTEVPVSTLQRGTNVVTFFSDTIHHGIEVLWPGPELIIRFDAAQPGCGDGVVGATEQ